MNGTEVSVLKHTHQVGLRGLLKSGDGAALETKISLEILSDFPDKPLERQLPDEKLSALLQKWNDQHYTIPLDKAIEERVSNETIDQHFLLHHSIQYSFLSGKNAEAKTTLALSLARSQDLLKRLHPFVWGSNGFYNQTLDIDVSTSFSSSSLLGSGIRLLKESGRHSRSSMSLRVRLSNLERGEKEGVVGNTNPTLMTYFLTIT
ncbi:hypothetical protein G4B88_029554 [Cannabis sativa]|uniref:Uncharacterized protein n=1 Tax=Cannabis sativa TaxID=3483 RepID=A0A7J6EA64_CANSA|nr:hypothetical protein G4B88_029554 [Cannabis sativa]